MDEVARASDTHDGQLFSRVHSELVGGDSVWGVTTCREFNEDNIPMLEQRSRYNIQEMAPFIHMACLHRMLKADLANVLCCFFISDQGVRL